MLMGTHEIYLLSSGHITYIQSILSWSLMEKPQYNVEKNEGKNDWQHNRNGVPSFWAVNVLFEVKCCKYRRLCSNRVGPVGTCLCLRRFNFQHGCIGPGNNILISLIYYLYLIELTKT